MKIAKLYVISLLILVSISIGNPPRITQVAILKILECPEYFFSGSDSGTTPLYNLPKTQLTQYSEHSGEKRFLSGTKLIYSWFSLKVSYN